MTPRIGVLGGMFDPVHNAHLQAALMAREACGLERVLLIPCGNPVHRSKAVTDASDRCAMLRLAITGHRGLELDTRECDSPAPSRTVDTLQALKAAHPGATLYFILGADAFLGLAQWYRWQDLFALAHLIVVTRPGHDLAAATGAAAVLAELAQRRCSTADELAQSAAGRILVLEAATPALSSSGVRARLADGQSAADLLPQAVAAYIAEHKLYSIESTQAE